VGVSRGHPFETAYSPLSYSGDPGVNGDPYRGGGQLETFGCAFLFCQLQFARGTGGIKREEDLSVWLPSGALEKLAETLQQVG